MDKEKIVALAMGGYISETPNWKEMCALINTIAEAFTDTHKTIYTYSLLTCATLAEIKGLPEDRQIKAIAELVHNLHNNFSEETLRRATLLSMPDQTEH